MFADNSGGSICTDLPPPSPPLAPPLASPLARPAG